LSATKVSKSKDFKSLGNVELSKAHSAAATVCARSKRKDQSKAFQDVLSEVADTSGAIAMIDVLAYLMVVAQISEGAEPHSPPERKMPPRKTIVGSPRKSMKGRRNSQVERLSRLGKQYANAQHRVVEALGDSCPALEVDLLNMRIYLRDMINFEGGSAIVCKEDKHICHQLCKVVDKIDEVVREEQLPILHVKIEGHVHKTQNVAKCWTLSKQRADIIVQCMLEADVPLEILHPIGLGGSQPIGAAADNRRIEIKLMTDSEVELLTSAVTTIQNMERSRQAMKMVAAARRAKALIRKGKK